MKIDSPNELLFAKIDDKIHFCKEKNKITHTDFFALPEIINVQKYLRSVHFSNYFFSGVNENADRKMLFFYPEKLTLEMAKKNINQILQIIRISLPNSLKRYIRT
jgi:RNA-binding protein YlmH